MPAFLPHKNSNYFMNSADAAVDIRGRQKCSPGSAAAATFLCVWYSVPERATYGTCVPCSKRLPGVRGAFSEAFGVKNRLFRYGRDIRYRKRPSGVPNASKARRTADSTDCGRPPGVRNAFSEACRAKNSTCRPGRIFSTRNGLREEVIRLNRGWPLSLSRLFSLIGMEH